MPGISDSFNAADSAKPYITADNVAQYGDASDVRRLTIALRSDLAAQAKIGAALATITGRDIATTNFLAYIDAVLEMSQPDDTGKRDSYLHGQIATPTAYFLNTHQANAASLLDDIRKRFDDQQTRQLVLDRMLRASAFRGHLAIAQLLLDNGANPAAENSRALLNALLSSHEDCAALLRENGADTQSARTLATSINYTTEQMKKIGLAVVALTKKSYNPDDFYHAGGIATPGGWEDRNMARERAVLLYRIGQPEPLQQFLRGYLPFKRSEEHKRGIDQGQRGNIINPLMILMADADNPQAMLATAVAALPARDRLTVTQLLLRHLCEKGASPLIIDAVIANGGDVGIFANMPLSLAVRGGHSDLALHLVRTHGANIGEAVMDAQINNMDSDSLKKLYTFMAAHMAAPQQAGRFVISKSPTLK